jgi:hypothetical protein
MEIFKVCIWIFLAVYLIFYIYFFVKIKNKKRFIILNTVISVVVFAIINLTSFATGIKIPINECTVIGTLIGNVPALCLVAAIRYIFLL